MALEFDNWPNDLGEFAASRSISISINQCTSGIESAFVPGLLLSLLLTFSFCCCHPISVGWILPYSWRHPCYKGDGPHAEILLPPREQIPGLFLCAVMWLLQCPLKQRGFWGAVMQQGSPTSHPFVGKRFGPALWGTDAKCPSGPMQGVQCPWGFPWGSCCSSLSRAGWSCSWSCHEP